MMRRWIGSCVGIVALVAACFVWSPPAGAAASSAAVAPMSGGPNCGKRAKVYDKIWSVNAHDRRVVFLRCGEFPDPPSQGWGWRHIVPRGHATELGWDLDFFMWAMQQTVRGADPQPEPGGTLEYLGPILRIRYEKAAGSYFRDEYKFTVIVIKRNGNVLTAYGNHLRTVPCYSLDQCKEYP
jgi:hypothetical protein